MLAVLFVGVLVGGAVYHRARAQMSESFFGLGDQMMRYAEARRQDAPRDLVLNGQTIRFSSGTANQPLAEVLDHFEARCAAVDGDLAEQIDELRAAHPEVGAEPLEADGPSMREERGDEGFVACLDMGPGPVSAQQLAERVARFGETGDVSAIGDMRYVFAEQYAIEGQTRTHFVGLWTRGTFDLERMFPEEGDAPGVDLDDVARPPESRRVLMGFERGQPYTMTVYASARSEAALESHFRRTLPARGWTLVEPAREPGPDAPRMVVAEQGRRMLTVVLQPSLEHGGTDAALFHSE
ncbi:MAG TPA: hypothetical protein RMH99_18670 [Sandaracinaceae bacterium LLY-WYZ-13_1]|nr:hypothetical protein [Sandaracinaceae bacterium LLY-WYZ-13_1]